MDTVVEDMAKLGAEYRARVQQFRATKLQEKMMDWITNPMPLLRLTHQPAVIPQVVVTERLLTKAAQVRAKIAEAKKKHSSHASVVQWACETLGMPKGQANRYVTENWNRAK
jgi:hypothetical protein